MCALENCGGVLDRSVRLTGELRDLERWGAAVVSVSPGKDFPVRPEDCGVTTVRAPSVRRVWCAEARSCGVGTDGRNCGRVAAGRVVMPSVDRVSKRPGGLGRRRMPQTACRPGWVRPWSGAIDDSSGVLSVIGCIDIATDVSCSGPCHAVRDWLGRIGVKTLYIEPGSPWENGYNESFNSKLRDEILNTEIFYTLKEAKVLIERWRHHYNTIRPHSSLGYRPPAPETILPNVEGPTYAVDGLRLAHQLNPRQTLT